jgi:hypothetical protein
MLQRTRTNGLSREYHTSLITEPWRIANALRASLFGTRMEDVMNRDQSKGRIEEAHGKAQETIKNNAPHA